MLIERQIHGVRFLCINCADNYSLCVQCEALRLHDGQHLFLKIYAPLPPYALGILPLPNLYALDGANLSAETGKVSVVPNWLRQCQNNAASGVRYLKNQSLKTEY